MSGCSKTHYNVRRKDHAIPVGDDVLAILWLSDGKTSGIPPIIAQKPEQNSAE